jgi:hypothetical protein
VARTMLELIERRAALDAFACFHMAGHVDSDGTQMSQAIQRVVLRRTGLQPRVGRISLVAVEVGCAVCRDLSRDTGDALSVANPLAYG